MKEIGFQNDIMFMNKITLQNNILMKEGFGDSKRGNQYSYIEEEQTTHWPNEEKKR